ncbi:MAG TPA: hypothetical protein VIM29_00070 [Bacillota bacterium]
MSKLDQKYNLPNTKKATLTQESKDLSKSYALLRWIALKAGWLVKEKGTWFITELGIEAYKKFTDPEKFHKEAVRLYRIWKRGNSQQDTDTAEIDDSATENNVIVTFENAEEQAWAEIEEFIKNKNP